MEGRDVVVGVMTVLVSLVCLVTFVAMGWYAVWRLFLSRFSFIRELFGNQQEGGAGAGTGAGAGAGTGTEETTTRPGRARGSRKSRRD